MVTVNILDSNEQIIVSLNTVEKINSFFQTNFSQNLIEISMTLMTEYININYDGSTYRLSGQQTNNIEGTSVITYKPF
ncbi:hypothetical protein [Tenacibaculum agarivorans]|uniref:hypothetical protein n=1 Tax=Tenacibaculum agarivorans TaxID=1908389 RepID=UPI00094B80E0|nr:hypothetical protein [Tenacibaculum agarivorans]